MYRWVRPLLFLLPAEAAHRLVLWVLSLLEGALGLCRHLRRRALRGVDLSSSVAGLHFPNPLGLAAGLDKDAEALPAFFALGFGFVEVGTVTPRPQPGNPRPRLFRLPEHRALINRMGFNNRGMAAMAGRLRELAWRPAPLGINVGKNKDTPNHHALDDYVAAVDMLEPLGDYLAVNASSPNTPGLRELQEPEALERLLRALRQRTQRPLFLKIAPDLGPEAVDAIVDVALACGVDGLIATNTTITRPMVDPLAPEPGGLSGAPLRPLANEVVRRAYARARGRLAIIGVGGVFTAEDAYEKIRAGASLIQLYTSLVYEGPPLVRRILTGLSDLLRRDGFRAVSDAVGVDASPGSLPLSTTKVSEGPAGAIEARSGIRENHR
ncbi:MAG: quinone-dependent dihydroorotate dehydrogenase [Myxococcota bacterium]